MRKREVVAAPIMGQGSSKRIRKAGLTARGLTHLIIDKTC